MKRFTATAAAASLLLLGPLGATFASADTQATSQPPAAAAAAGSPSAPSDSSGNVLGPDGYKGLRLGQSQQEAEQTGLLVDKQHSPGCDFYYLAPSEGKPNPGSGVFIEPTKGVVVIGGTDKIKTPEGVTIGTTLNQVKAAYPDLEQVGDYLYETPVPGGSSGERYRIAVNEEQQVSDFALQAADRGTCG